MTVSSKTDGEHSRLNEERLLPRGVNIIRGREEMTTTYSPANSCYFSLACGVQIWAIRTALTAT